MSTLDDDYYEALGDKQIKASKNYDILRNYYSIPIGSTVMAQEMDGGPLAHGTVVEI